VRAWGVCQERLVISSVLEAVSPVRAALSFPARLADAAPRGPACGVVAAPFVFQTGLSEFIRRSQGGLRTSPTPTNCSQRRWSSISTCPKTSSSHCLPPPPPPPPRPPLVAPSRPHPRRRPRTATRSVTTRRKCMRDVKEVHTSVYRQPSFEKNGTL